MTATSHMISASPRGARPVVEDAARLHDHDLRGPFGFFGSYTLTVPDGTTLKFRPNVGERHGWVHVEHWPAGAGWASSTYDLPLYAQDQHLGGVRWFFACPLSGGRTPVLYLPAGGGCLGSREAHGLAFASQRLRAPARAATRARRIKVDFGGPADLTAPFQEPPRGMWARTYERRSAELARLAAVATAPTPC